MKTYLIAIAALTIISCSKEKRPQTATIRYEFSYVKDSCMFEYLNSQGDTVKIEKLGDNPDYDFSIEETHKNGDPIFVRVTRLNKPNGFAYRIGGKAIKLEDENGKENTYGCACQHIEEGSVEFENTLQL